MGPGDPFSTTSAADPPKPAATTKDRAESARTNRGRPTATPRGVTMMESTNQGTVAIVLGTVVGLLFGVLVTLSGPLDALVVLAMGALGAFLAWLIHGAATGRLDFGGAWRSLRRK